jgi:hypothetical protein
MGQGFAPATHNAPPTPPTMGQRIMPRRSLWPVWTIIIVAAACVGTGLTNFGRYWALRVALSGLSNNEWQGYPRLSPFEAVQWHDLTPHVQVGGKWYELLTINDVPASQVVAFSMSKDPSTGQKHFDEDLVELLMLLGHWSGNIATLNVREDLSGSTKTLHDVPMTEINRNMLLRAGVQQETSAGNSAPVTQPATQPSL